MFLESGACSGTAGGDKKQYLQLEIPDPKELPFDHHDIKVYIDTLFLEGILQPVSHEYSENLSNPGLASVCWLTAKETDHVAYPN